MKVLHLYDSQGWPCENQHASKVGLREASNRTELVVAEAHELHLQLSLLAAKPPHHYALAGCDLPTQQMHYPPFSGMLLPPIVPSAWDWKKRKPTSVLDRSAK